jgi:hypothetical protein
MKTTAEAFALAQWLEGYPDYLDYQTILDKIADGDDEDIWFIELIEYEPPQAIVRHIEATKTLFQQYASIAIQESKR